MYLAVIHIIYAIAQTDGSYERQGRNMPQRFEG